MPIQTADDILNSGLIPFVVGISGHRELRPGDIPGLEDSVLAVFQDLQGRMAATPILLLSGLADGADQLAAGVALKHEVKLAAVLPMAQGVYRATLTPKGQEQFDKLLKQAALVIELPPRAAPETPEDRYEALAVFLSTHCQALIALWDGEDTDEKGGTSRVVRYVLEGPPDSLEDAPQAPPVYHIHALRKGVVGAPADVAGGFHVRTSLKEATTEEAKKEHGAAMTDYHLAIRRLNEFNLDVASCGPLAGAASECLLENVASPVVPECCMHVAQCYRLADKLSLKFNLYTKRALKLLLICALLAVTGYELYAHVFPHQTALWLAYPVSLLLGWGVYRVARQKDMESRYLDYRALAEALRVQFFWGLAGIRRPVADYYLRNYRTELDWIRSALRSVALLQAPRRHSAGGMEGIELALTHWVKDQETWFEEHWNEQRQTLKRLDRRSEALLIAVGVLSVLIPASLLMKADWLAGWRKLTDEEFYHGLLLLLVPLPTLGIGLFRVWVEQGGYAEHARKYRRMHNVFKLAAKRLPRELASGDLEQARETLRRLGIEALEENGDWLLLHRERPLEVKLPG